MDTNPLPFHISQSNYLDYCRGSEDPDEWPCKNAEAFLPIPLGFTFSCGLNELIKLLLSFSGFSWTTAGFVGIVLHPPVNLRSANWLTNFCVFLKGIGLFSISIFNVADLLEMLEPVDNRFSEESPDSSIRRTTSSMEFRLLVDVDISVNLAASALRAFLSRGEWSRNFSFFFRVHWFCLAKHSPKVMPSSGSSANCVWGFRKCFVKYILIYVFKIIELTCNWSKEVVDEEAEADPEDNGGVVSCWVSGKSWTKSGWNLFLLVKMLELCVEAPAATSLGSLVVSFCHFSRFCWKMFRGWYSLVGRVLLVVVVSEEDDKRCITVVFVGSA